MTVNNQSYIFKQALLTKYDAREVESFYFLLLNYLKKFSKTDLHLKGEEVLKSSEIDFISDAVGRLLDNEPIQYIIGETEFYDLPFIVNKGVLIPRQETEELVRWVLTDIKDKTLSIIDVCCGSGCIGVSIKSFANQCEVDLLDLSKEAIVITNINVEINNVKVNVIEQDVLSKDLAKKYDIIVSNPPYVKQTEKQVMNRNVLDYEPHLALFVDDNNALVFYDRIGQLGLMYLNKGGCLYFEINESLGANTVALLQNMGYQNIILRKDLNGKDRMIKAVLPSHIS